MYSFNYLNGYIEYSFVRRIRLKDALGKKSEDYFTKENAQLKHAKFLSGCSFTHILAWTFESDKVRVYVCCVYQCLDKFKLFSPTELWFT